MGCIKTLIVLPMASLYLSIMTGRKGTNELMPYPMCLQMLLEKSRFVPLRRKAVGKLRPIIRLDALNGERERFYKVIHKLCGGKGAVLLKGFHKTPPGILINGGVLEKLLPNNFAVFKAGGGDEFHIHLDTLAGIVHLFIGLRDVFRIWRMDSHDALFFEEAIETGNGAGVTTLSKLYPENDQAGIRIASAHIHNQLEFLGRMLVGMVVGTPGAIPKGFDRAVKATLPAIDILPVGFVFDSSVGNPVFLSIVNQG